MFEIGNTLREARLRRGLDIAECEAETKIRAKYLRALEDEEFDLLPAPSYVRGFLRTYADYLGLDGQLVLDEYNSRTAPPRDFGRDADRVGRRRQNGRRRRRGETAAPKGRRTEVRLLWLAIGGVMTTALLLWMGAVNGRHAPEAGVAPPPTVTAASVTTTTSTDMLLPDTPVDDRFVIAMTGGSTNGSWLQVQALHRGGKVLYEDVLAPGQSISFKVRRSLWVRVGNTAGVSISVDGASQTIDGGTTDYLITRNGLRPG